MTPEIKTQLIDRLQKVLASSYFGRSGLAANQLFDVISEIATPHAEPINPNKQLAQAINAFDSEPAARPLTSESAQAHGKEIAASVLEKLSAEPAPAKAEPAPGTRWLIWYEDVERDPNIFWGHGAEETARRQFAVVRQNWSCHLFRSVADNCEIPPAAPTTERPGFVPQAFDVETPEGRLRLTAFSYQMGHRSQYIHAPDIQNHLRSGRWVHTRHAVPVSPERQKIAKLEQQVTTLTSERDEAQAALAAVRECVLEAQSVVTDHASRIGMAATSEDVKHRLQEISRKLIQVGTAPDAGQKWLAERDQKHAAEVAELRRQLESMRQQLASPDEKWNQFSADARFFVWGYDANDIVWFDHDHEKMVDKDGNLQTLETVLDHSEFGNEWMELSQPKRSEAKSPEPPSGAVPVVRVFRNSNGHLRLIFGERACDEDGYDRVLDALASWLGGGFKEIWAEQLAPINERLANEARLSARVKELEKNPWRERCVQQDAELAGLRRMKKMVEDWRKIATSPRRKAKLDPIIAAAKVRL